MSRRRSAIILLASVVLLAVAIRAMLPVWIRDYANAQLEALNEYDGHLKDVDLSLWRGAYRMERLVIVREDSTQEPFFISETVDLSIEWRSLLRGEVVGTVKFDRPIIRAVQADMPDQTQLGQGVDWFTQMERLFPFQFNTVGLNDGTVYFRAPGIALEDAIKADQVQGQVTNLTNVAAKNEAAFATFDIHATVLGHAPISVNGKTDPLASSPTFDVNLTLAGVQLPSLNPWLKAYAGVDAEAGTFDLATEVAAKDEKFVGYVKPVMRNVRIHRKSEDAGNPLQQIWEQFVELVAELFENQPTDQIATRIPLSGTLKDPDADALSAIGGVLRNAFVGAFARSLENSVSLGTLDIGNSERPEKEALDRPPDDNHQQHSSPRFGPRSTQPVPSSS